MTNRLLEEIKQRNAVVTEIIAGGDCPKLYDIFQPSDIHYLVRRVEAAEALIPITPAWKVNLNRGTVDRYERAEKVWQKAKEES